MLSPTALARYIACPLKFYFATIARLKVSDEIAEEVDNPMFGTILHAAMQRLYGDVRGMGVPFPNWSACSAAMRWKRPSCRP